MLNRSKPSRRTMLCRDAAQGASSLAPRNLFVGRASFSAFLDPVVVRPSLCAASLLVVLSRSWAQGDSWSLRSEVNTNHHEARNIWPRRPLKNHQEGKKLINSITNEGNSKAMQGKTY